MSRVEQERADRGSQRWLQDLTEKASHLFGEAVLPQLHPATTGAVTWISPVVDDGFTEYRDDSFLKKLEVALPRRALESFWPERGPVWDGLARTERGDVLLIEAKANVPELASPGSKASKKSMERIERSLTEAKPAFGAAATAGWSSTYYQYANRLAHLYLLRELNHVSAYLVFLYFVNATDVAGPKSTEEWRAPIRDAHERLGLRDGRLSPYVIEAFVDVAKLASA